jgi:predicted small integral membrane protein
MAIRYSKILLVLFVGLQGWLYVAGNLANWEQGLAAISYVIGMHGHAVYPIHIFPPLTGTGWAVLAFLVILCGEFSVGALSLWGCWKLWTQRKANPAAFHAAKTPAMLGAAMGLVVWFGFFVVIGGALFQMWQTQVGEGSFRGAFIYAITSGMVLLFLQHPEPELQRSPA